MVLTALNLDLVIRPQIKSDPSVGLLRSLWVFVGLAGTLNGHLSFHAAGVYGQLWSEAKARAKRSRKPFTNL